MYIILHNIRSNYRIAEIPLRGAKESLNVSVAAGIVLFGLCALPPTRNKKVITKDLRDTRRYNKRFLGSVAKGLRRSVYFTR